MSAARREAEPRLYVAVRAPVGRPALSLALSALATAALVPAFALLAPTSTWTPETLVGALAGIALVSYFGGLVVERELLLDSGVVVALVALVFLGPLPAACIWIGSELVAWLFERQRLGPRLSTVASYGWAVLAGGLVLEALTAGAPGPPAGAGDYPAVALVGLVLLLVSFFVGPGLLHSLRCGQGVLVTVRRDLIGRSPATLPMIAAGVLTVFAYAELGVLALALFSLIVVLPQLVLPALLAPRPVSELEHTEAVALYAQAIADAMKVGRADRVVLRDAAGYVRERPLFPRSRELRRLDAGHRLALVETVLYAGEHWDGVGGTPGAIGGEMIPLTSRILAVADAWGGLTAKNSPKLTHSQVLYQLEARAGMHFDPAVVAAAAKVVRDERLGRPAEVAYQPRAHRLPVPRCAARLGVLAGRVGRPEQPATLVPVPRI